MESIKEDDKIKLNLIAIEELRRYYDQVSELYTQIRTRILAFLGGGFAVLGYLYGNGGDLFIPKQIYGMIFYLIGFMSFTTAMSTLFRATRPVIWRIPTEIKDLKQMKFKNELKLLEYIKDEYLEAIRIDSLHCEKKQQLLTYALYLEVIGGIVLLVLKNFPN